MSPFNPFIFLRNIIWAVQRKHDLRILWPQCRAMAPDLDHAKGAFLIHAQMCPCWIDHYGQTDLISFIGKLE